MKFPETPESDSKTHGNAGRVWLTATGEDLGGSHPQKTFAVWGDLPPRIADALSHNGHRSWPLPEFSDSDATHLLARYNEITTRIGTDNGPDSLWWYTWTSSRDRFHSEFLGDLEFISRFENAITEGLPDDLIIFTPDPYLSGALRKICRENGIKALSTNRSRVQWFRQRLRMITGPVIGGVKSCVRAVIIKWRLRRLEVDLDPARSAKERTVLVTWLRSQDLTEDKPPSGTFFGSLPDYIAGPGESTVFFGDLLDGVPTNQPSHRPDSPMPVVAMAAILPLRSIALAFIQGLLTQIKVNHALSSERSYLKPLLKRDIHINLDSIIYSLLLEKSLRRLVRDFRPTQIIHMCENNPWERVCSRVISDTEPAPVNTGYMHCAVLIAHTKIVITEEEKQVRPRPSKIICTGPKARDLMVQFGGHSPDEVVAGCALRHGYLASVGARSKINSPIQNILVVLEGLPTMSHLVRFIFDALEERKDFNTVIRPHPAYRFDLILRDAGLSSANFSRITISQGRHIEDDFEKADLVIYMGTTAAVEAGYMGIPLIHYKHPNLLTDDPLFEVSSLKKIAETPSDLFSAIEEFGSMGSAEFKEETDSLRAYIDDYLAMPSPETTSAFHREPKAAVSVG